jgi:hypothetical protein
MEGFTLTKWSFDFQPCKTVALLLRECIELIPPSAIFSLARCTISFLMNLQSTVVGPSSQTRSRLFRFAFFAAASSNCDASLSASPKNRGQEATLHYAAALHCPCQTFLAKICFWLKHNSRPATGHGSAYPRPGPYVNRRGNSCRAKHELEHETTDNCSGM